MTGERCRTRGGRPRRPILDVRHSIDAFMRRINVEEPNDLEDQLRRLFSVAIRLRYHNGACECVNLDLIAGHPGVLLADRRGEAHRPAVYGLGSLGRPSL